MDKLKCELDYICNHIKDEELAGYLVDESMSGYIRYFGSEGMEAFLPLYREKVKDEKQKAAFFRSYEQYTRLEKGRKAPHFSLLDKDGNRKNLSDWLGNYVYIDVWATWCGPCMRLLPEMEKLAEKYKGKVIFYKVNADKEKDLCSHFSVQALPTLFFIPVGGKPIIEVGATPEKYVQIIEEQLLK